MNIFGQTISLDLGQAASAAGNAISGALSNILPTGQLIEGAPSASDLRAAADTVASVINVTGTQDPVAGSSAQNLSAGAAAAAGPVTSFTAVAQKSAVGLMVGAAVLGYFLFAGKKGKG